MKFTSQYNATSSVSERAEILQNMKNEMIPLMKQNDRYATGLSLYEMITGELPDQVTGKAVKPNKDDLGANPRRIGGKIVTSTRSEMDEKLSQKLTDPMLRNQILDMILPLPMKVMNPSAGV